MQPNSELPLPLSDFRRVFKIPILKLIPVPHLSSNFYRAITSFGDMCLIIENFVSLHSITSCNDWITQRNLIMHHNPKCFPLIFQQHVLKKNNCTICLTLIQDCTALNKILNDRVQIKLLSYTKLVKSLSLLEQNKFKLSSQIQASSLLYLNNSQQICLDFTKISNTSSVENSLNSMFLSKLQLLMKSLLMRNYDPDHQIHQIIFIQGKIYTFQPAGLTQATDYTELLIFMNAPLDYEVNLINRTAKVSVEENQSSTKIRKVKIKSLEGNPLIQVKGKRYSTLNFQDGKCTNCLREIFFKQLATKFIHENSLYKLQQFEHLVVRIFKNFGEARKQQIITVYPPVSKAQLISFLIAYINCLEPLMKKIEYLPLENTLKLIYQNRRKQEKVLTMVFYEGYIVKDQQISMILERSSLLQCKLDLREMKISDSFLIFLSHNQKARQIKQLYLTDSYGLSDVGLSTFLKSSNSQNLQALSLIAVNPENSILEESLQIISEKESLKKLQLKKSSFNSSALSDEIDLSKLSLNQLQCTGIKISLSSFIKGTLKILKIDQLVPIEELKYLKHLKLTELKLRLVESSKKTLIQSFSSFSPFLTNKNKEVQVFAEGQSRDTLKKIDISNSNCKFKTMRPLLLMEQLQQVNLSGCINLGTEFDQISQKVLIASFAETDVDLEQLKIILKNTTEMVQLNIMNTKLTKHEIIKLLLPSKMYINNLILSETQFTNKLLDFSNGYELIQCIELCVDRFLEPEQQYSFNLLIEKASASTKTLRFVLNVNGSSTREQIEEKKQLLISRINKYLIMSGTPLESLQNLYANKMKITEILQILQNFQVEDSCQSTVASSIAISTERCRIISTPKIIMRRNSEVPILFKILQKQTIDKFTHRFVKFMQENDKFVSVDLSGNKLIGKEAINMILQYGRDLVRQIDMRNCMFHLNEVIDTVFEFRNLDSLNAGEVSVKLTKQTFVDRSQRYLKFFMRVKTITKLKIECEQIEQLQILFSVLSHLLDQCSQGLNSLTIYLTQITLNKESYHFFETMFRGSRLIQLDFRLTQCRILDRKCSNIWYKGLSHLRHLQKINLSLPAYDFPLINLVHLIDAGLQFTDGEAEEAHVNKCLRNLVVSKNLRSLRISLSNCSRISNLSRVFWLMPVGNLWQKLPNLEHLSLNFEYCPLKQQSVYELLGWLIKVQTLKMLQLNVSFAIEQFPDLVNYIEKMADEVSKPMGIKIICVTENSNTHLLRTESLAQKGILFVL